MRTRGVLRSEESRFSGETEFGFRHALLREAAYAMLSETDRQTGHALAGAWLASRGERDARVLASHFERGRERSLAVPWLVSAADTAADGCESREAHDLAARGLACGAHGLARGQLRLVQAQAFAMSGDLNGSLAAARDALADLAAQSTEWFRAVAYLLVGGSFLGDAAITSFALGEVQRAQLQPDPSGPYGAATFYTFQGHVRTLQLVAAWCAEAEP